MRRLLILSFFMGLPLSLSLFFFFGNPYGPEVYVRIPEGFQAREVAHILYSSELISSPRIFLLGTRLMGLDRRIQSGIYRFHDGMWLPEILWVLSQGKTLRLRVTVPEGWRANQIAERLEAQGITSALDFLVLAKKRKSEGHLFPTTYFFQVNFPAELILGEMVAEFEKQWSPQMRARAQELGMGFEEVLTLASIVEREAVYEDEKGLISSVYHNRLRKNRPLEADPTVQYALGYWKSNVTYKDLEINSPYNTYRHRVLPPGPLCSVSLASLKAALWPRQTDFFYFVADNRGRHPFHKTYPDFLKAKYQAKKERTKLQEQ